MHQEHKAFQNLLVNGVPHAPFKKNWHEYVLKKLLLDAAKQGHHGLAVSTGEIQSNRYPRQEGSQEKIAQENGMKGFYDKIIPDYLNKLGKKYGAKVEQIDVPTPKVDNLSMDEARKHYGVSDQDWHNMNPAHRMDMLDQYMHDMSKHTTKLHHFPITEEMRSDLMKHGLPIYAQGGNVQGQKMDTLSIPQMKAQLGKQANPDLMSNIGINEALDMNPKVFINPDNQSFGHPSVGGVSTPNGIPIGGIDRNPQQPGQQLMPQNGMQPNQGQHKGNHRVNHKGNLLAQHLPWATC